MSESARAKPRAKEPPRTTAQTPLIRKFGAERIYEPPLRGRGVHIDHGVGLYAERAKRRWLRGMLPDGGDTATIRESSGSDDDYISWLSMISRAASPEMYPHSCSRMARATSEPSRRSRISALMMR
jgi:hypothetical protein